MTTSSLLRLVCVLDEVAAVDTLGIRLSRARVKLVERRSWPLSILCRPLDAIDHEHVYFAALRLELEPEILLNGREE